MSSSGVTEKLFKQLDAFGVAHTRLLDHPPSRSSVESRAVRRAASGVDSTGAKALVVKLTGRDKSSQTAIFVLPGDRQFDADLALRQLPAFKRLRFLTREEVQAATTLEVGAIPPFGAPVVPGIDRLYVDPGLLNCELIGFNAAAHTHSVLMRPEEWLRVARPDQVVSCAAGAPVAEAVGDATEAAMKTDIA